MVGGWKVYVNVDQQIQKQQYWNHLAYAVYHDMFLFFALVKWLFYLRYNIIGTLVYVGDAPTNLNRYLFGDN